MTLMTFSSSLVQRSSSQTTLPKKALFRQWHPDKRFTIEDHLVLDLPPALQISKSKKSLTITVQHFWIESPADICELRASCKNVTIHCYTSPLD